MAICAWQSDVGGVKVGWRHHAWHASKSRDMLHAMQVAGVDIGRTHEGPDASMSGPDVSVGGPDMWTGGQKDGWVRQAGVHWTWVRWAARQAGGKASG